MRKVFRFFFVNLVKRKKNCIFAATNNGEHQNMVTVTLEYNNNNTVLSGILDAVAKMPDVKVIKTLLPNKTITKSTMLSDEALFKLADEIKASMNPNAPVMTMEEIVQEVRDYRNGK